MKISDEICSGAIQKPTLIAVQEEEHAFASLQTNFPRKRTRIMPLKVAEGRFR